MFIYFFLFLTTAYANSCYSNLIICLGTGWQENNELVDPTEPAWLFETAFPTIFYIMFVKRASWGSKDFFLSYIRTLITVFETKFQLLDSRSSHHAAHGLSFFFFFFHFHETFVVFYCRNKSTFMGVAEIQWGKQKKVFFFEHDERVECDDAYNMCFFFLLLIKLLFSLRISSKLRRPLSFVMSCS